jgi:hypothetical protein
MNRAELIAWYWQDFLEQKKFPVGTEHPQVETQIAGVTVWCDIQMVPVLKRVNRFKGVATLCSCQGNYVGRDTEAYLFVAVESMDVARKLIKRFGKPADKIAKHKGWTDQWAVTWRWKDTYEFQKWAEKTFGLSPATLLGV